MSKTIDLESLIFRRTIHVPIVRKELTNALIVQLNKIFQPISHPDDYFFNIPSWNYNETENWIDFALNLEYCFIKYSIGFQKPTYEDYWKFKQEFEKDVEKAVKKTSSIVSNGYPFQIHIEILESDENGCVLKINCFPFIYFNMAKGAQVDNIRKQNALISCQNYLEKLIIGINGKDRDEYELSSLSSFLGTNQNWIKSIHALQLQEISIILVAQKKGIILNKPNVERILNKQIPKDDPFFNHQYEAFVKEAKNLYGIEIPFMALWLRKMRQAVLHEGHIPTDDERELAVSATISLLKQLKKVYDANFEIK